MVNNIHSNYISQMIFLKIFFFNLKLASVAILFVASASADKYGGGGDGYGKVEASGTACIVKVLFLLVLVGNHLFRIYIYKQGSYCNCHYCKCEKGSVHCDKHGYGETTFNFQNIFVNNNKISFESPGKKYCFGSSEGQYCHCDFCKCSKGFGSSGYGKCH